MCVCGCRRSREKAFAKRNTHMTSSSALNKHQPNHLILLIHGVNGSALDTEFIGRAIRKVCEEEEFYIAGKRERERVSFNSTNHQSGKENS